MEKQHEYKWEKFAENIADLSFSQSGLVEVEVNGKKICVGLYKDSLYACAAKCPHAGGIMAEGYIDAIGNIVCPVHRYKYSMENGRNTSGEGYYLKRYPVEIRPDGVFIGFSTNIFG